MVPALPTWRTMLNVVVALVVILVVTPFVVYAVPSAVGAEASYVVISGSMEPTIRAGDVVVMNDVNPESVEEGDVIAYRLPDDERPTTHRVVGVVENGGLDGSLAFRTKGDANEDPDQQLVPAENLNGRLMTIRGHPVIIPYIGYVVQFVGTREGFLALVVAPLALLVGSEVWGVVRSVRANSDTSGNGPSAANPTHATSEDTVVSRESKDTTGTRSADAAGSEPIEIAEKERRGARGPDGAVESANGETSPEQPVVPVETTTSSSGTEAVTLTRTDLKLTLPVLIAFFGYSVWTTYNGPSQLSIALTVGTGMTLLAVTGLFVTTGSRNEAVTTAQSPITDVRPHSYPDDTRRGMQTERDSETRDVTDTCSDGETPREPRATDSDLENGEDEESTTLNEGEPGADPSGQEVGDE